MLLTTVVRPSRQRQQNNNNDDGGGDIHEMSCRRSVMSKIPKRSATMMQRIDNFPYFMWKKGKAMNDVSGGGGGGVKILALSPDSDCNSNHHNNIGSASYISNTSSQDIDFIQDNSDYQWFLDYGYRDGGTTLHHTSILSLPESYEANDLNYYDTLAKNMDANLAEADMESFRTEDIHALLTNLPPMCTADQLSQELQNNRQGESFASVSGSMMAKFDFNDSSSMSPHSSSQEGDDNDSNTNSASMSIYKSELLFSPVKEHSHLLLPITSLGGGGGGNAGGGGVNFSVDSLDCDMMLTACSCQANKENYTIAFEGSCTMYSEDSDYHETDKSENSGAGSGSAHFWPTPPPPQPTSSCANSEKTPEIKPLVINSSNSNSSAKILLDDPPMTQSDSGSLTTWSKLKKRNASENQLRRHPSGNNNNGSTVDEATSASATGLSLCDSSPKSQSMPDLYKQKQKLMKKALLTGNCLKEQQNIVTGDNNCTVKRKPVKVFDIQHHMVQQSGNNSSIVSDMATSVDVTSTSDTACNNRQQQQQQQQNFSLVKLFMKQKSMSTEVMSTTMDQLSSTENWPANQSGVESSNHSSAASSSGECKMAEAKMAAEHLQQPITVATTSTSKQQSHNLETSNLSNNPEYHQQELKLNETSACSSARTYDLIAEEPENELVSPDLNSRSLSCEQLSESISKIDSCNTSFQEEQLEDSGRRCNNLNLNFNGNNKNNKRAKVRSPSGAVERLKNEVMSRSIQTSQFSEIASLKNAHKTSKEPTTRNYLKVIEPSFLSKLKHEGEEIIQKPIYVLYPNYVLPNLDFLNDKQPDVAKVLLMPQEAPSVKASAGIIQTTNKKRPFSLNDLESLKKKGFSHVKDWDSLTFLLPQEYRRILADVPEVSEHITKHEENLSHLQKPSFLQQQKEAQIVRNYNYCDSSRRRNCQDGGRNSHKNKNSRPMSCCDLNSTNLNNTTTGTINSSSSSSQPCSNSSGYRGSSTILTSAGDSHNSQPAAQHDYQNVTGGVANNNGNAVLEQKINPLFVYKYDSVTSSEASLVVGGHENSRQSNKGINTAPPLPVRCVSLPQQPTSQIQGAAELGTIPPRPPLPKSILRNNSTTESGKSTTAKRHSLLLCETSEEDLTEDTIYCQHNNSCTNVSNQNNLTMKRRSLPQESSSNLYGNVNKPRKVHQQKLLRNKRFSETEDEGVDAGTSSSSLDEHPVEYHRSSPDLGRNSDFPDFLLQNISTDELTQLEEFLKMSGISSSSWNSSEDGCENHQDKDRDSRPSSEESLMHLRSYVGKFLALKINQDQNKKTVSFAEKLPKFLEESGGKQQFAVHAPPNNSPNVSAFVVHQNKTKTLADIPICEETEPPTSASSSNLSTPQQNTTPVHRPLLAPNNPYNNTLASVLSEKRNLVNSVTESVEQLIKHFSSATSQSQLTFLGDSNLTPQCAKLALKSLCPALYAILSDGLKPALETSFGAINNSVWQVVEASAQQGPLTKALNELVMRINSEDAITEGLVKFNAFVFGLLNVRSLDAWMSYLKTRETILKKHYTKDSLMIMAHTGGANVRTLLDGLIAALQPLALLPFQLDLLFEYRQLHLSFKRMDSYQQQLSPSHKQHTMSPNFKQWSTSSKLHHSSGSNRSNSDSEELNTVKHFSPMTELDTEALDQRLPDLLNNSAQSEIGNVVCSSNPSTTIKLCSNRERPRSCVESGALSSQGSGKHPHFKLGDVTCSAKKRWSGIASNNKLYLVYDRLAREEAEEEYTDSLENGAQQQQQKRICPEDNPKSDDNSNNSDENIPSLQDDRDIKPRNTETAEPESLDSNFSNADEKPINGRRFKKLQQKWEMLSGQQTSSGSSSSGSGCCNEGDRTPPPSPTSMMVTTPVTKSNSCSKIPRPITSPSGAQCGNIAGGGKAHSGIPVLVSPSNSAKNLCGVGGTSKPAMKKTATSPTTAGAAVGGGTVVPKSGVLSKKTTPTRTSRLDQVDSGSDNATRHVPRPSSLPYKAASAQNGGKSAKVTPPRRAASSSLNSRKPTAASKKTIPKVVRTLSHRLPSESGHLSYNEGERLRVILEVDDKWLLCCRGNQKGLVPKSCVISADTGRF